MILRKLNLFFSSSSSPGVSGNRLMVIGGTESGRDVEILEISDTKGNVRSRACAKPVDLAEDFVYGTAVLFDGRPTICGGVSANCYAYEFSNRYFH